MKGTLASRARIKAVRCQELKALRRRLDAHFKRTTGAHAHLFNVIFF